MKKIILLFTVTLCLSFSCKEKKNACDCKHYLSVKKKYSTPILEFRLSIKGSQLGGFTNSVIMDTTFLNEYNGQLEINEFLDVFRINISEDNMYLESPVIGYALESDTSIINKVFQTYISENDSHLGNAKFLWSKEKKTYRNDSTNYHAMYAVVRDPKEDISIINKQIVSARKSNNRWDNSLGVAVSMSEEGTKKWEEITTENVGNYIAVISHNKVLSSPIIIGPISQGETLIAGNFTDKEADSLVKWINCDALIRKVGKDRFEKEIEKCN